MRRVDLQYKWWVVNGALVLFSDNVFGNSGLRVTTGGTGPTSLILVLKMSLLASGLGAVELMFTVQGVRPDELTRAEEDSVLGYAGMVSDSANRQIPGLRIGR